MLSIFEEHSDIIQTGGRETIFGHKIYLTCGKTSLIVDCLHQGNPADQAQMQPMLERQHQLYGRYPRQASFDGGFATQNNLKWAKKQGIQDVAFAKKAAEGHRYGALQLGLQAVEALSGWNRRPSHVQTGLRSGSLHLEGIWEHFQQYVHLSVLSFNLLVLARLRL